MNNNRTFVLNPLTSSERQKARNGALKQARERLSLNKPSPDTFIGSGVSDYPSWVMWAVGVALAIVIFAAFIPSAIGTYNGARDFYYRHLALLGVGDDIALAQAAAMAGATIVFSEVGLMLLLFAIGVLPGELVGVWRKRILYVSAALSIAIPLVANITVGKPVLPMEWLLSIAPPTLTIGTAIVIERFTLQALKKRHESITAYIHALSAWESELSEIETSKLFQTLYAHTLKDRLIATNARRYRGEDNKAFRKWVETLSGEDWARHVMREMQSDQWVDNLDKADALSEQRTDKTDSGQTTDSVSGQVVQTDRQGGQRTDNGQTSTEVVQTRPMGFNPEPTGKREKALDYLKANPDIVSAMGQRGAKTAIAQEVAEELFGDKASYRTVVRAYSSLVK